jgi:hypothetical protein
MMWLAQGPCDLRTLHAAGLTKVTDAGARALAAMASLSTLDLSRANKLTDEGVEALVRDPTATPALTRAG